MPAPTTIARTAAGLVASGELFFHLVASLKREAWAFLFAATAIPLGIAMGWWRLVYNQVNPIMEILRPIPPLAWIPLSILWFGIGDLPKLVVVTLMVFYIIFITTSAGIRAVDQRLIAMARIAGAGETAIAREIIWKSLLPFFFTGLKVALPRAVSATIVGEFLVATEGVGHYIEHSRQVADTVGVFAGIVIAMVLVLAINAVVNVIERRALAWRPVEREMEL